MSVPGLLFAWPEGNGKGRGVDPGYVEFRRGRIDLELSIGNVEKRSAYIFAQKSLLAQSLRDWELASRRDAATNSVLNWPGGQSITEITKDLV